MLDSDNYFKYNPQGLGKGERPLKVQKSVDVMTEQQQE